MKNLSSFFARCLQNCSGNNPGVGAAIMRIGVGLIFVLAGVSKLVSLKMTVFMFAQVGLAAWWVYVVAIIEAVGGFMLMLGLFTSMVAIPLGITMLVASVIQFRFGGGLMGAISPLVLFLSQVQFYLSGSKTWSLENRILCSCGVCDRCVPKSSASGSAANDPECKCCNGSSEDCGCDEQCNDCDCATKKN